MKEKEIDPLCERNCHSSFESTSSRQDAVNGACAERVTAGPLLQNLFFSYHFPRCVRVKYCYRETDLAFSSFEGSLSVTSLAYYVSSHKPANVVGNKRVGGIYPPRFSFFFFDRTRRGSERISMTLPKIGGLFLSSIFIFLRVLTPLNLSSSADSETYPAALLTSRIIWMGIRAASAAYLIGP